ncbi:uncharacterized protein LOC129969325 [Argiope bruennichi]|uniref:uncharacterized protein LOC129969325 n=1 Tax=Argiope bruennichi TaxID=94029 RepID=UPI00249490BD|nr:uncharacterized protein LOC129969325 [Argiope bruennichi]
MIRTRSRSRSRGRGDLDINPFTGTTRRGTRYSLGSHDPRSPKKSIRRHSESRMEYGGRGSGSEVEPRRPSRLYIFFENLIINISETFDILGKKSLATMEAVLEMILNCLINFIFLIRRILRLDSSSYDRSAARNDIVSFLSVGFWSLIVTLFFIPPDPEINVIKRAVRFVVGTFQTTGLLFVLFFMLYLHKMTN